MTTNLILLLASASGHKGSHHVHPGILKYLWVWVIYTTETSEGRFIGFGLALFIWISGIVYCDRASDEMETSEWAARFIGLLLPIIGPAYYAVRRAAFRQRANSRDWQE